MKSQYRMLFAMIALLLVTSLACYGGTPPTATSVPTNTPAPTKVPQVQPPAATPGMPQPPSGNQLNDPPPPNGGSPEMYTFTDQNDLLSFDLPGDWTYENVPGDVYYTDIFTSPDGSAKIESLVYNDGTAFTGKDNGRFALYLLNTFYSNTGKEGDIRVSEDSIMPDGSEKLTWTSKGGGYSGVSFFELRGSDRMTFLMFTLYYSNDADQAVLEVLDNAINTYVVP